MYSAKPLHAPSLNPGLGDERVLIHNVRWKDYLIVREALDTPGLRMTYCEGALEIMSPSRTHERWKTNIARLIETYALERDVPLYGYGSTTFKNEMVERGAEPDECYRVRAIMHEGEIPDVVLEVIYTNPPLIDKLRVYSGLRIPEVWFFRDGAFELFRLADGTYRRIETSIAAPEIDLTVVARFATREDQHEAVKELCAVLRSQA